MCRAAGIVGEVEEYSQALDNLLWHQSGDCCKVDLVRIHGVSLKVLA